jgi:hypothetical protein
LTSEVLPASDVPLGRLHGRVTKEKLNLLEFPSSILSVTLFEKTPILCALDAPDADAEFTENVNQLILFDI